MFVSFGLVCWLFVVVSFVFVLVLGVGLMRFCGDCADAIFWVL